MIQDAFSNHAYALAREGKYDSALEVLEKSKSRSLNQALLYQRIRTAALPTDIQKQFTLLLQEIHNLQEQLKGEDMGGRTRYTEIAPNLRKRQKKLKKLFQTVKKELHLENLEEWSSKRALKKCKKIQTGLVVINVTPVGAVLLVASPNKEGLHKDNEDNKGGLESIFLDELTTESLNKITWQGPESWVGLFPRDNSKSGWERWSKRIKISFLLKIPIGISAFPSLTRSGLLIF